MWLPVSVPRLSEQPVSIHKISHPKYLGRHLGRDGVTKNIPFSRTSFFSSVGVLLPGFRSVRTTATDNEKERRKKKKRKNTAFRIFAVCKPEESSNSGPLTGQLGEWINMFSFAFLFITVVFSYFFLFGVYNVFVLAIIIVSISSCLVLLCSGEISHLNPPARLCCT